MRFALTEDQIELRDALTDALATLCPATVVRVAWEGAAHERCRDLTAALAGLDLPGVLVPAGAGGLGLDPADAWPLWEATGYAGVPAPVLETSAVVAPLLTAAGSALAAGVLDGSSVATCVLADDPVPWGTAADVVVVLRPGVERTEALVGSAQDLVASAAPAVDRARPLARIGEGASLTPLPAAAELVEAALLRLRLGYAAQLVGLARRMLDLTVDFVTVREQFGQPVGSFQAVKHHLATQLVRIEEARASVAGAAWGLAQRPAKATASLAVASLFAREVGESTALTSIQCHGAMAYTTEYDLHLFAKRAWALASTAGSTADETARLVGALGLGSR